MITTRKCERLARERHANDLGYYGQVRKNMSWFHMGDVISPYEMKSAESELAHDQNTAFHLGNLVDVFIWRIFIPPTYDLAFHRRDLGK